MKRFVLIGNPANRRIAGFARALEAMGQPPPVILAHRDLLTSTAPLAALPDEPCWVRLDSTGEDDEVQLALLALGFDGGRRDVCPDALRERPPRFGEVVAPAQLYRGMGRYLDRLDAVFRTKGRWQVLNAPATVRRLFDKSAVWRQHKAAGLSVPDALPSVESPEALREEMAERGWTSAYVKLRAGSSASGLAVFTRIPAERVITTALHRDGAWFNTRRMQRLTERTTIDRVLSFLLQQGAQVEQALPKARLEGHVFDLRVLTLGGDPAFMVIRQSRHQVTNLHLGGWRGDPEALAVAAPPSALEALRATCRAAASLQDSFQLGLDVLFTPGFRHHALIEANAFGDLLPRLTLNGRSVYEEQIHRLTGAA